MAEIIRQLHMHAHMHTEGLFPLRPPFPISGTKHSLTVPRAGAAAQLAGAEMLMLSVKG